MRDDTSSWERRQVLKLAGGSVAGVAATSQLGTVGAQSSDASITINDQETDGDTVALEAAETDIESQLIIISDHQVDGVNINYRTIELEPGTSFTDRVIELTEPIPESQRIRAEIRTLERDSELLARDGATVAVGEPLDEMRPTVERIEADPSAGFHSPYFLFIPETPDSLEASVNDSQRRPLLVQTHVWGDFDERVESARQRAEGRWIADEMNCPMLVAPFPFNVDSRFGLQEEWEFTDPRRERTDLQLLAMIEDAKSRLEEESYTVAEQIHFSGGSSAGVFIDTFAALHPEHVNVFSSGANGATFLPIGELTDDIPTHGDTDRTSVPWPFGTADFETRVGEEFNEDAWMDINQYRWIGAEDQDRENTDRYLHKAWKGNDDLSNLVRDVFGRYQVDHRFETSRAIYDHLNVPAEFVAFEGAGHVPEAQHRAMIDEYHRAQIAENHELIHLIPQEPTDGIQAGDTVTVPVLAENPTVVRATTSVTLAVDGTEVDTAEITVDPNSTETVELETVFEEADDYTLSLNGTQADSMLTVVEADSESGGDSTDSSDDSESEQEEPTVEEQPGFGIWETLAALGGIGYLIRRRITGDGTEAE